MSLDLADIQGLLLRGYNLPFAHYLFVSFADPRAGRRWLRELAPEVTTAREWPAKPPTTLNVALTCAGLRALGRPEAGLPGEFREGMAARAEALLGDTGPSHPDTWERGLGDGSAHALLLLHARDAPAYDDGVARLRERIERAAPVSLVHEQRAAMLPFGREHFGFSDGLAQPSIEGAPVPAWPGEGVATRRGWRRVAAGEFVLGARDEDDQVPAVPFGRNGSFLVYRKLHQDVAAFRAVLRESARALFDGDEELVAAKIVGRWRDGSPIALAPDAPNPALLARRERLNDFRYADDPDGLRCPIGAHIRRTNPRDGLPGGAQRTRRHRILRRGMPYGMPLPEDAAGDDGADRGLIFICLNASIARQFELVSNWCMDGDAFGLGDDTDFLLGRNEPAPDAKLTVQGHPPRFVAPQPPLVITRGGEYLLAPGLRGLDELTA